MIANKNAAAIAAAALAVSLTGASAADGLRIAYFASASQNGFNQAVYAGIQEVAAEHGAETAIYDGQFNAEIQYNQIEDVLAGGNFDAFIVLPNDTVGIAGAFEQVIAAGTPIATTLFPVGPDLNTLEPQVEGITATVASLPVPGATLQAQDLATHCENLDPCNVVILIGAKIFPFDVLRMETYYSVFDQHENIDVVAVGEGWYDPDTSLTVMTDILQANSEVHAIVSVGDQHLLGAEIALEGAGHNVPDLYLSGGGAATISVDAIREGRWDATLAFFPHTMGKLAAEAVIAAANGEDVDVAINLDVVGPLPPIVTKAVLDANPDFQGEWAQ
ncbi:MAG: sugar ABC transporter substrate-binding protein [Albidovulum sp.]|nr:sugar ABC transporter substrate-binding protein [Albidovulum sp.]